MYILWKALSVPLAKWYPLLSVQDQWQLRLTAALMDSKCNLMFFSSHCLKEWTEGRQ